MPISVQCEKRLIKICFQKKKEKKKHDLININEAQSITCFSIRQKSPKCCKGWQEKIKACVRGVFEKKININQSTGDLKIVWVNERVEISSSLDSMEWSVLGENRTSVRTKGVNNGSGYRESVEKLEKAHLHLQCACIALRSLRIARSTWRRALFSSLVLWPGDFWKNSFLFSSYVLPFPPIGFAQTRRVFDRRRTGFYANVAHKADLRDACPTCRLFGFFVDLHAEENELVRFSAPIVRSS